MNDKICLIIPNSIFLLDARVFPFLGILKVASAFEKQGEKVDVIDLSGVTNWKDVIRDYFSQNKNLKFVGLTATTPQMPECYQVALEIRKHIPTIKLVLGGPHGTAMNAAAKLERKRGEHEGRANLAVQKLKECFDVIVCGDGELTLPLILSTSNGIIDADDRKSELFLSDQQFTDLPEPARWLVDLNSYNYSIEGHKATSLIAQLGCPYRCTFCGMRNSPSMRVIRNRTTESIVKEVEGLHKTYGFTGFMMYDDELNVSKSMISLMNSLTDLQMKLGVEFRLRGFLKSELTTEEQLIAMKRAGFRWLLCGFESGNERILKNIEKQATVDDNSRFMEMAKKHGLKTKALMSIAHCGESYETIEDTKNWLIKMDVEDFDCTVITTYGGSPYYDLAQKIDDSTYVYIQPKTGDKLYQKTIDFTEQADYYKGQIGAYTAYVWTDYLSSEQLVKSRDELEVDVRRKLNIPFNPSAASKQYEHSMGSSANILPDWIFRSSENFSEPKYDEISTVKQKKALKVLK